MCITIAEQQLNSTRADTSPSYRPGGTAGSSAEVFGAIARSAVPTVTSRGMPKSATGNSRVINVNLSMGNSSDKADPRPDRAHKVQGPGKDLSYSNKASTVLDATLKPDSKAIHVGKGITLTDCHVSFTPKVKKVPINMYSKFDADSDAFLLKCATKGPICSF